MQPGDSVDATVIMKCYNFAITLREVLEKELTRMPAKFRIYPRTCYLPEEASDGL